MSGSAGKLKPGMFFSDEPGYYQVLYFIKSPPPLLWEVRKAEKDSKFSLLQSLTKLGDIGVGV
jgi:hypothetical protein